MNEELTQRYLTAVRTHQQGSVMVTPSVLAAACMDVLPVDGAGISLVSAELRVPLGWSSATVAAAEQLQVTLGDGPCLSAASDGRALIADGDVVSAHWPVYHQQLSDQTPFASVAAVPLAAPGQPSFAALNLYSTRPDFSSVLALPEAAAVAAPIVTVLLGMLDPDGLPAPADLLTAGPAEDRMRAWQAVGMVMAAAHLNPTGHGRDRVRAVGLNTTDALAVLRGYAYSHDLTLDQVTGQITNLDLDPVDILA